MRIDLVSRSEGHPSIEWWWNQNRKKNRFCFAYHLFRLSFRSLSLLLLSSSLFEEERLRLWCLLLLDSLSLPDEDESRFCSFLFRREWAKRGKSTGNDFMIDKKATLWCLCFRCFFLSSWEDRDDDDLFFSVSSFSANVSWRAPSSSSSIEIAHETRVSELLWWCLRFHNTFFLLIGAIFSTVNFATKGSIGSIFFIDVGVRADFHRLRLLGKSEEGWCWNELWNSHLSALLLPHNRWKLKLSPLPKPNRPLTTVFDLKPRILWRPPICFHLSATSCASTIEVVDQ